MTTAIKVLSSYLLDTLADGSRSEALLLADVLAELDPTLAQSAREAIVGRFGGCVADRAWHRPCVACGDSTGGTALDSYGERYSQCEPCQVQEREVQEMREEEHNEMLVGA